LELFKLLLVAGVVYILYQNFLGEESGCDKYASKFSCNYVENKATYNVYYWRNVNDDNASDERLIGMTVGLANCKNSALTFASSINERWNERSYICVLMKEGRSMEKHRIDY
jgi:hypothetical protein